MSRLLALSDVVVCWTPNLPKYPAAVRAKVRIFTSGSPADEWAPFEYRAGACHPRGLDPRLEVRQAYALEVALTMVTRDRLSFLAVHRLWCHIDEYRSGCCAESLVPEWVPQ
jgi:hypothetical protein